MLKKTVSRISIFTIILTEHREPFKIASTSMRTTRIIPYIRTIIKNLHFEFKTIWLNTFLNAVLSTHWISLFWTWAKTPPNYAGWDLTLCQYGSLDVFCKRLWKCETPSSLFHTFFWRKFTFTFGRYVATGLRSVCLELWLRGEICTFHSPPVVINRLNSPTFALL